MRFVPGFVSVIVPLLILSLTPAAPLAAQQAERRWIVDNAAASSGDGSPASPFVTLREALRAAGEGDVIVLSASEKSYQGGVVLRSGQSLVGEGGAPVIVAEEGDVLSVAPASGGITIANVVLRATGKANGITVRETRGVVTLRDVAVSAEEGTGISAAKAQKLAVTGNSSVVSAGGPALRIEEAELDVMLRSVAATGKSLASAILLEKTTGRFTVEGVEGTAGSGGTIEGTSGRAVSVIDATNVTLRHMHLSGSASVNGVAPADCGGNLLTGSSERCHAAIYLRNVQGAVVDGVIIDGSGQAGLVAHQVTGLTLTGSTIRNAGDELFEHALVLEELAGQCRIAGTTVERSASRHLMLHNSGGRLELVIETSTFLETAKPHGQQGVLLAASGDAVIDLRVRDSIFTRSFASALEVTGDDTAAITVRVTGSTFDQNGSAISLATTEAAMLDYFIADNPSITGSETVAINIFQGTPSTGAISGTIARNVIGKSGVPRSGTGCGSCSAIVLSTTGNGDLVADISGNVVQQVGASAIHASASQGAGGMHITAAANLLREGGSSAPAIRVQSGAAAGDANAVCADLGGPGARANKIEGIWEPNGAIHLVHRFAGTHLRIAGLTTGNTDAAAAAAVAARNGGVKIRAALRPDSAERGFEPAERCTMPALTL